MIWLAGISASACGWRSEKEVSVVSSQVLLAGDFATLPDLVHAHGVERGDHPALIQDRTTLHYHALDARVDRIAASLQRDGLTPGMPVSIIAAASIDYVALFVGALRAGGVPAPIAPSSSGEAMAAMIADAGGIHLFLDRAAAQKLADRSLLPDIRRIALDMSDAGSPFEDWLVPGGVRPKPVAIAPQDPFNIIYSSGTTGTPKGIVQSHAMRWAHIWRGRVTGFAPDAITLLSTPLYSNTTLVALIPTLAYGGTIVLMARFDAGRFLAIAAQERVTHAALVPVQYSRILAHPDFDATDLSAFRMKTCTSAPFSAALKADVLRRWPGGLIDVYGMTEGGGTMTLAAHLYPDKLHTVGKPVEGHDIRLIGDDGEEVQPGKMGEVVGRSPAMMTHYHNQPDKTHEAEWYDAEGRRYIRTGDVGRFDEDGFLVLMDRKKDMIISGGFNVYPSDIEAVLVQHPAIADIAVVGVPSEAWGETPVGFAVASAGARPDPEAIRTWLAEHVGATQRLSDLVFIDSLPRSAIGKVLKRELRDRYNAAA
jgi:acyl-CoA synthetase (AMP-forming)/AMP-acid ligase II